MERPSAGPEAGFATLTAAARLGDAVAALVSRGDRPDLATDALPDVRAPTLLIVGARDRAVLARNRWAAQRLTCEHRLTVVPGAGHLLEEQGAGRVGPRGAHAALETDRRPISEARHRVAQPGS